MGTGGNPRVPLLFSYGSLQQEDVQLSTFGRLLQGRQTRVYHHAPTAPGAPGLPDRTDS